MKKLLTNCFLLLTLGNYAQTMQNKAISQTNQPISTNAERSGRTFYGTEKKDLFIKEAKKNKIHHKKLDSLEGIKNGYYAIVATYSDKNNLKKAVEELQNQGFASGTITNPKNNMGYAYIGYYPNWPEAIADFNSKFNGAYAEDAWILNVENSVPIDAPLPLESVTYEMLGASKIDNYSNGDAPNNEKLLQKAALYFDKMWYAEAAELYELALSKNKEGHSYEVLQKAGDAHYFNTNMERAYYWYNMLYEKYEEEMTAENIFKYAHSLKGTGKYSKAKRLMRLYERKMVKGNPNDEEINEEKFLKESILDNIPNRTHKVNLKNLSINSEYSDFSPAFYNTDELVFSSSRDSLIFKTNRYKWNNQPFLDLYVGQINEESQDVKKSLKFSKKINSKYHEASVTFSPDNTTMYFTRNNYGKKLRRDKNGINNLKIYKSQKVNGVWTEATEMPFNSDDYSTGHPSLSPDGKKLYFVSDMPGSLGMTDIFVVDVLGDGTYSQPKNLGAEVNTEKREMFPFVTDKKLYFSSDGREGLGGLDIYEAPFDQENGFSMVVNLGMPINSNKDDFSFIVDGTAQKGYFASNRDGGKGDDDIYSFQRLLPEETAKNAIAGVITALESGETIPVALISLLDGNNIKLRELYSDEDGGFVFEDLENNTKYSLQVTADGFETTIGTSETKENITVTENIALRALHEKIIVEEGIRKFKTEHILFDFDKSHINKDASLELEELVLAMQESPGMTIKIESHTDSRGNSAYNKYLSDKRAKSTRDYIVAKGIDPSRIESAIGYGEERLLNGCDGSVRCTEAQHLLNRRSEFIIVKM